MSADVEKVTLRVPADLAQLAWDTAGPNAVAHIGRFGDEGWLYGLGMPIDVLDGSGDAFVTFLRSRRGEPGDENLPSFDRADVREVP